MTTLKLIDEIMAAACQLRVVRWALVAVILVLLAAGIYLKVKNAALSLQVSALKGERAEYAAMLTAQNAAIKKAGDYMAELQKRRQEASRKAADLSKQLRDRQKQFSALELTGDCPDMVQQIIEEVRK